MPEPKSTPDPVWRVELDGFSILGPRADGWSRLVPPPQGSPNLVTRLYFIKVLNDGSISRAELHRITAVVRTRDVSAWKIEDRSELLRVIARSWHGSSLDRCLTWECVRYDHTFESEPGFTIRHHGFVVLHRNSPTLTLNVEYRQYYGREARPLSVEALEKEVDPSHRSLEFTTLRSSQSGG